MKPAEKDLIAACEGLAACDKALKRAYSEDGLPEWRSQPCTYESLARIIAFQQISTKAAASIWGRVLALLNDTVTVDAVLACEEDALRECGMSRPKIRHMNSIAEAISSGDLPMDDLPNRSDEDARALLVAVKGIGPWTADVFLMTSLGRMDGFPSGDVGLMEAHRMLLNADERLPSKDFTALAETWRPWRGVAAHMLWGHINKVRDAAPVGY